MTVAALIAIAVLLWLRRSPTRSPASGTTEARVVHPEQEAPCGAPLAHRPRNAQPRRAQRWAPSARSRAEPRTGPSDGPSTASTARTRLTIASTAVPSPARWATCPPLQSLTSHINSNQHTFHSMILG